MPGGRAGVRAAGQEAKMSVKTEEICKRTLRNGWELVLLANVKDQPTEHVGGVHWSVRKGSVNERVSETTALALILDAKGAR